MRDGRIVEDRPHYFYGHISWTRAILLCLLLVGLVATNPAHEATTARLLSQWKLQEPLHKLFGLKFSSSLSSNAPHSYWKRRTTNYGVAAVKERSHGLEVGALQQSFMVCTFDDADWGALCRAAKSWFSHPGLEWWRLTNKLDPSKAPPSPPVVAHRLLVLWLLMMTGLVACHIIVVAPIQDPLLTMFLPPQNNSILQIIGWLFQGLVDANVLLYPVLERLYQMTTLQATTSPCRIAGSNDAVNFYAALIVLAVVAAGVRLLSGHHHSNNNQQQLSRNSQSNQNAWLVFVLTALGYWRGTFARQQEQPSFLTMMVLETENNDEETNNLVLLAGLRIAWFMLSNGIVAVFDNIFTWALALMCGAALGDYHFSQQIWEVWSQSWDKFWDDTWTRLFGRGYRTYY